MATRCLVGVIVTLCAVAATEVEVPAQPAMPVGQCFDHMVGRLYDVDSNGWFRNAAMHSEQFQAVRDPSGMTMMLLPSGVFGSRFWITWQGQIIRIEDSGRWTQVGACMFAPQFVQALLPSPPPPPTPQVGFELEGPSRVPPLTVPKAALEPEAEFLPPVIPDATWVASCPTTSKDELYACVAKNVLGKKKKALYDCVSNKDANAQDRSLCLLETMAGKKERQAIQQLRACSAQHGADWNKYPVCMADGTLDPDTVRALQCAQQSAQTGKVSYWQLATCYGGPKVMDMLKPNAEMMIIYECAMASGGEPELFVGCAGGRLATAELDKCLTHGIGGDGCFGKNNTITKTLDEIENAITDNFGKKSVFADGWRVYRATMDPAAAAKAINNIAREGKKAEKKLKKAADNVVKAAKKALPRIKW